MTAGDGVVSLMERIWLAFQDIDISFGALGGAVFWAQDELLPILIEAPADRKTRNKWLDRLWQAIEGDAVDYLSLIGSRWGELCGSREVASNWADRFLGLFRTTWSDPRPGNYVRGASVRPSSLLAAGRHQEVLEVLSLQRFLFWHDRKFGLQALLSECRTDEALAYAKAFVPQLRDGQDHNSSPFRSRCRLSASADVRTAGIADPPVEALFAA